MKVTFYSNFLNHHQLPFCEHMVQILGNNFKFVATEKTPEERLAMGYSDMNIKYKFVVQEYKNKEEEEKAYELAIDSDVIIFGSAPRKYLHHRMKEKKLSFIYSERILKNGVWKAIDPIRYMIRSIRFRKEEKNNVFLLAASAYTPLDYSIYNSFKNKAFKWGYFPEIKKQNIEKLVNVFKGKTYKLIWVGRFIDWKHPEVPLQLALALKRRNIDFELNMIGDGILNEDLKTYVKDNKLSDYVNFKGSLPFKQVRTEMEKSDIFIFSSDFGEGWGAVLNEAMNSGLACIASHAIGSVPYLLKDGYNGYIYENGNFDDLVLKTVELIDNPKLIEKFSINAYNTLEKEWNAGIAAKRILEISNSLLKDDLNFYDSGPCSKAMIIPQNKKKWRKV